METRLDDLKPESVRSDRALDAQREANLLLALDMFSTGVTLMRERVERDHPELSEDEIAERVVSILRHRPLDAPGRIVEGSRDGKTSAT